MNNSFLCLFALTALTIGCSEPGDQRIESAAEPAPYVQQAPAKLRMNAPREALADLRESFDFGEVLTNEAPEFEEEADFAAELEFAEEAESVIAQDGATAGQDDPTVFEIDEDEDDAAFDYAPPEIFAIQTPKPKLDKKEKIAREKRMEQAQEQKKRHAETDRRRFAEQKEQARRHIDALSNEARVMSKKDAALPSLFAQFNQIDAREYQTATGYWRNTYLPGDAHFRQLHFTLNQQPRLDAPEQGMQRVKQPFDQPEHAAMSVYLASSQAYVGEKTRMLLQVGLKGNLRGRGSRPAMNVGVVLDLTRPLNAAAEANVRALLLAFVRAKQIGDQFSLTIAGKPGGVLIPPEHFQYGAIKLAQDALFAGKGQPQASNVTFSLLAAMQSASKQVAQDDDPSAPLGASLVVLVTANDFRAALPELRRLAHTSAVHGIPHSVIGLGDKIHRPAIDQLILAGQGHRRYLQQPDQAKAVVERELNAISRVIARAVRVNIRLGANVHLLEVLGAERLDAAKTQRVQQMEKSIDLRLARNLGVKADRGDDDDGIQIIIPAFFAGDAHVILLDVVMDRPGTLADVSLRYKDLAFAKNSLLNVRIGLNGNEKAIGPLQKNVYKNFLALRLSECLQQAADMMWQGRAARALQQLRQFQQQLAQLPTWMDVGNDPDLQRDQQVLSHYLHWMRSNVKPHRIAQSLRYAGFVKRAAKPVEE